jgi:hypothetical protein
MDRRILEGRRGLKFLLFPALETPDRWSMPRHARAAIPFLEMSFLGSQSNSLRGAVYETAKKFRAAKNSQMIQEPRELVPLKIDRELTKDAVFAGQRARTRCWITSR